MLQEKQLNIGHFFCPETCHQKWMNDRYEESLVSVVIPTYNRADLLIDAMESVWRQTYRPIELFVIDDASTDQTQLVVDEWAKKRSHSSDLRVHYLYQSHRGAPAARNLALIESKGEYIQFLDSDDVLCPEKIAWGVEALSDHNAHFVYFKTQQVGENLSPIPGKVYGKVSLEWHDYVVDYLWHTSGPFYRREVIKEIGPWLETLSGSQDWEYGSRIKLYGYHALCDERIGSLCRNHNKERISLANFDYKYTHSAELAYDYIVGLAEKLNSMNDCLGNRFLRLYLTRALEYNCTDFYLERDRCLNKALTLPSQKNFVWFVVYLCQLFPNKFFLALIDKVLVMRRNWKEK